MRAFDPFGWSARFIPQSLLHKLIQVFCAGLCAGLIYVRLKAYPAYSSKALWWGETALFSSFAAAFLLRRPPVRRARGAAPLLLAPAAALLPFALAHWPGPGGIQVTPLRPAPLLPPSLLAAAVVSGNFLAAAAVAGLRRSFSVLPEARELVTGGIYRWVRHPIYLGELLAAAGIAAMRWCPRNAALLLAFAALQAWRSREEERVLAGAFPEYAGYRRLTGSFLPKARASLRQASTRTGSKNAPK